jgi:aminoglycoside phosphotransferase (APT) family kinase protein
MRDDVREVLREHLPGYDVRAVRPCGAGTDNVAFDVNGDLIVRFRRADPAGVDREARLLAVVAHVSPFPVPEPLLVDADRGVLAYRRLPGVPMPEVTTPVDPVALGEQLGDLLTALHAVPPHRVADLVETDDTPPGDWLVEADGNWPTVAAYVPAVHRAAVDEFLAAPPPAAAPTLVFSHADLGIEHVLVDPATGSVRGIIDWADAAVGDPAYDMGLILRDLGPGALDAALGAVALGADALGADALGADAALRDRAGFYARCGLLADLAYGMETGRRWYADKSLVAMRWLFAAG